MNQDNLEEERRQLMQLEAEQSERLLRLNVLATLKEVSLANIQAVHDVTGKLGQAGDNPAIVAALRVLEASVPSKTLLYSILKIPAEPRSGTIGIMKEQIHNFPVRTPAVIGTN